jgi:hypothetical protein
MLIFITFIHSVKASKIKEMLLQNPEAEQTLFAERARFDLIVYYDQNSKNIEIATALLNLKKVLVESQNQLLRRPPMMLIGGFDAWQSSIGERGVYRFPQVVHKEEKKHWFKSSTDSSNTSISSQSSGYNEIEYHHHKHHNTLYDYVSIILITINLHAGY